MRAPAVLRSIQRGARLAQVRAQAPQSPSLLPSLRPRDDCLGARSGGIPGGTLGPLTEDSPCNSSWRFKQAAEGEEWSLGWPWLSRARSLGVNSVGAPEAASRVALSQRHFAARSAMAPPLSVVLEGGGRVLSIQSHTVQGYVGNKSAVFPLQILGFDVDPINSVQFSNHTAYPVFKGQVLNGEQLWELIEGLEANNLLHYTHLLTGYVGSLSFLETILRVLEKLRAVNPDLKYVCDPVLGDQGKLYVKPELVDIYRAKVVPAASLLTPNQFEAELLTGVKTDSEEAAFRACDALHEAGPSKVVITSLDAGPSLVVIGSDKGKGDGQTQRFRLSIPRIPSYFTGTGDLLAALLLGWSYKYPHDLGRAIELSVASVQAVLKRTLEDYAASGLEVPEKEHELRLIQSREDLLEPPVTLKVERLTS